jgi:murein L,D-transpeptidase YafK
VKGYRPALALVLLLLASLAQAAGSHGAWLLVDTHTATAEVRRDGKPLVRISNLSFGRGGVSRVHEEGDETTPLGEYHIRWINRDSQFHVFLQLDYPNMRTLDEANRQGLLDDNTYESLLDFAVAHGYIPQNSPLGGHIGLHGLGKADPKIHRRFNWTEGCVAMTDAQIDKLLEFVSIGTRVVIR